MILSTSGLADIDSFGNIKIGEFSSSTGSSSQATAPSIAIGEESSSSAQGAVAIGINANAKEVGSIALGSGSATEPRQQTIDGQKPSSSNPALPVPVLSLGRPATTVAIGSKEVELPEYKRQIIHVADGQTQSDAATVGQLKIKIGGNSPAYTVDGKPSVAVSSLNLAGEREGNLLITGDGKSKLSDYSGENIITRVDHVQKHDVETKILLSKNPKFDNIQLNDGAIDGLSNKGWNDTTIQSGRAATEDQLLAAQNINKAQLQNERSERRTDNEKTRKETIEYSEAKINSNNQRIDQLLANEKKSRTVGDTETLKTSTKYTDEKISAEKLDRAKANSATLSSSREYTDTKLKDEKKARTEEVNSAKQHTDEKFNEAQMARKNGDNQTLNSAIAYTNKVASGFASESSREALNSAK